MKLKFNRDYTLISIYAVIVFSICLVIYKATLSLEGTTEFISKSISVIAPIFAGLLIAYFMNPFVNKFELVFFKNLKIFKNQTKNAKLKRVLAIFLSYSITLSFLVLLLIITIDPLITSLDDFVKSFDTYYSNFISNMKNLTVNFGGTNYSTDIEKINAFVEENLNDTIAKVPAMITDYVPDILGFVNILASMTINILVSIVISIYVLFSKEKALSGARKGIIAIFNKRHATAILETLLYTHKVFSSFFLGKLLDSLLVAMICFPILTLFQIPFALLLSVIVGLTNVIPYFGPFIGGVIGVALLILVAPFKAFVFFIIIIALQQFDGNILGPMILGDSLNLAPFWIIFSIILFGSLFGPLGMIIGAPLFSVIKSIIEKQVNKKYEIRMCSEYHDK